MALALLGFGIFLFLRRRARRWLDRIQRVRPGGSLKEEEILAEPEPFVVVDPFMRSTAALHERMPLSPSTADLNAQHDRQQASMLHNVRSGGDEQGVVTKVGKQMV